MHVFAVLLSVSSIVSHTVLAHNGIDHTLAVVDPVVEEAETKLAALEASVAKDAAAIASDLAGIPPAVVGALGDPAAVNSLLNEFKSTVPSWYTALPTNAQGYLTSAAPKIVSIQSEAASLKSVIAGATTTSPFVSKTMRGTGGYAAPTGHYPGTNTTVPSGRYKNSTSTSTSLLQSSTTALDSSTITSASVTATRPATTTRTSSTSTALAAKETAALAISFIGALGVLGLAAAL